MYKVDVERARLFDTDILECNAVDGAGPADLVGRVYLLRQRIVAEGVGRQIVVACAGAAAYGDDVRLRPVRVVGRAVLRRQNLLAALGFGEPADERPAGARGRRFCPRQRFSRRNVLSCRFSPSKFSTSVTETNVSTKS